jgi:hypothetical protein
VFIVLLAAFKVLLHRHTGGNDEFMSHAGLLQLLLQCNELLHTKFLSPNIH